LVNPQLKSILINYSAGSEASIEYDEDEDRFTLTITTGEPIEAPAEEEEESEPETEMTREIEDSSNGDNSNGNVEPPNPINPPTPPDSFFGNIFSMATIRHHLIMETGIMEMVIMVTIHLKNLTNQIHHKNDTSCNVVTCYNMSYMIRRGILTSFNMTPFVNR
jgi:hypothetical protein